VTGFVPAPIQEGHEMRAVKKLSVVLVTLLFVLPGIAAAADFSPKISSKLSTRKVKKTTAMKVHVEQDEGEEELAHVTLGIPRGFRIPKDAQVEDGDVLGSGEIFIEAGPACSPGPEGAIPVSGQVNLPATLEEMDRTDEEADAGVWAVWVLDIQGVTRINLTITGGPRRGFKLDGDIPPNNFTCPPFVFDLTIQKKSEGGVPILKNPRKAGRYVFSSKFQSLDSGAVVTIRQRIKITR
jgi:hypothetical protein